MAAPGAWRTMREGKDVRAGNRRRTGRSGGRTTRLAVVQAEARGRSVVFQQGVMLSKHSTWGIGGPAMLFVEIFEPEDMVVALEESVQRDVPLFVLGRGSNCLFDDRGFEGIVALNNMSQYQDLGEGRFRVGSGRRFDHLGVKTSKEGWTGLEFAAGIPGTVGGAVYMNAGANQQQTSDVLVEVEYLDSQGKFHTLKKDQAKFGYRMSPFQEMPQPIVVTSAVFQLRKSDKSRARVMEYMDRRRQTQPLHEKSAGCVFRNPGEGHPPVGYLIEHLGMKGLVVGGASVSHVHGNFLISKDGCQCSDMLQLIEDIKSRIKEATGIDLEEEIHYVPPQGFHRQ
uniref:UDP-N-acetylmuramate dehydrogenase n=1 Tax=Picocystis salinarum TaxID=88271 RepID=A0A7S3XDW9_9CHLO|mmetsp:Transcript_5827/g.36147  ORF Transcript_5827/g.36147 Transcript_5827/m.36147 type:complete len:340 (+) Transcript_5827:477-1496(+)